MNQTITLQLNNQIVQALQHLAQEKNLSLSEAALYSLHQSFNLPIPKKPEQTKIGNALDHFMGACTKEDVPISQQIQKFAGLWTEAEAQAFRDSLTYFDSIDEDFWQ